MTTERRRRRHAAMGARVFLAGASVSGALVMMVMMAHADRPANTAPPTDVASGAVVVVAPRASRSSTEQSAAPPVVTATRRVPIAASRAS